MENYQSYFKQLIQLVELELSEEKEIYFHQLKNMKADERRRKGYSWFPLEVVKQGYSLGQLPFLVVQRNKMIDQPHQFRAGSQVELFNLDQPIEYRLKGMVHWADRNKLKLLFNRDKLPDWIYGSKTGIDLYFDERTYKAMDDALKRAMFADKKSRLYQLAVQLIKAKNEGLAETHHFTFNSQLNESQNNTVKAALENQDFTVIHGPPGTGKSTTLIEIVIQNIRTKQRMLLCTPSNAAADHLCVELDKKGVNVIRLGNLSRMRDQVWKMTMESAIDEHPDTQSIKKMKIDARDLFKAASKYKRNFDAEARAERTRLYQEAKMLREQIRIAENYLVKKLIDEADVICTTLVSSDHRYLEDMHFDLLIIDEAAQALEPACWIPLNKCERVIMAGDPFQLPPTVKSYKAAREGLEKTLMERLVKESNATYLLDTQYRMHEIIMNCTNQYFYKGLLKADDSVRYQQLVHGNEKVFPLEFIDTAGAAYEEKQNSVSKSYYNPEEYRLIGIHLTRLFHDLERDDISIAIITPYSEQVKYIRNHLEDHFLAHQAASIEVDTVDAFQGREKDVIYISMVRSNAKSEIGFLKDYRRMNVAVTRARKKLVIVGDSATIGNDSFYSTMLDYFQESGAYKSVWEMDV